MTKKEPDLHISAFEDLQIEGFDFIYSIDVIEHVADVEVAFGAVSRLLKPNGLSIHSIDFAGHNAFGRTQLGFLTCSDWLWHLLHSNIVTTNRVRFGEALSAMRRSGLLVEFVDVLVRADEAYIDRLRPRMLARYKKLPADDLGVLQAVVGSRKLPS